MLYSIKCPICFDLYDKETKQFGTFLCGHIYCIQCLEEMQKYLDDNDMIRCPTCNVPTLFYVKLFFNTITTEEKENLKKVEKNENVTKL
uniref:RING-type domain-containing protein n=1 Tax=Panagrolaimus sp. PS1159 TaxID=55785 RepID=A0AC35GE56_9BILA